MPRNKNHSARWRKNDIERFTDDELALAWFACGHASAFWRKRCATPYARREEAKYNRLSQKLDVILNAREAAIAKATT